jgi:hypothetical protein
LAPGPLLAAISLAAIFVAAGRIKFVSTLRGVRSFSAGVATAYVFIEMLPEMDEATNAFVHITSGRRLPMPGLRVNAAALAGFVLYYGFAQAMASRRAAARADAPHEQRDGLFWAHIGGFSLYVWLIGYLLVNGISDEAVPLGLYTLAMAVHFLGVGRSLHRVHGAAFDWPGRYVLAAAVLAGYAVATVVDVPKELLLTGYGLVCGGVIMNSMIMELSEEREGGFSLFALGAGGYAVLLALMR